ncbi:MAG: MMPL family transporter [Spirochaetes bacterium]|nr:MMPL family transporter [Spirochaetota bacterium]
MRKIINLFQNKPIIPIVILLGIIGMIIINTQKLDVDTSERSLFIKNDPELVFYDETVEKFISDSMVMIYIEDQNIFTFEKLTLIENMLFELEKIDGVINVESLFDATNFKSDEDFLNLDPFIDEIPEDQADIDQIKQDALKNPIVMNNLLSKSTHHLVIKLFFDPIQSREENSFDVRIVNEIEKILNNNRSHFTEIFQTGNPFVKKTIFDTMMRERMILYPISIIIMMLMLILTIRSLHGAILPLLTSLTSIGATIAFMNIVNIPLNFLTFIIPSLIVVIGSTEDTHIIFEYFEGMQIYNNRKQTISYLGKKVGTAILITSITTFFGFAFVSINKITVLRQFGIAAAFGMLINPFITVLLFPVYLRFLGPKKNKERKEYFLHHFISKAAKVISEFVLKRNKLIIGIFILFSIFIMLFIPKIELEYEPIHHFEKKSPLRQNVDKFEKNVSGSSTIFLRIKGFENSTFTQPVYLQQISQLQQKMEMIEGIDKVTGITDYIQLINREMNYGDLSFFTIPDNEDLINQYFLLMDPYDIQRFITNDYDEINIIINHHIQTSHELDKMLDEVHFLTNQHTNRFAEYRLTGFQLLSKDFSTSLVYGTFQGIIILTLTIFILISILFLNIKAGLISFCANLLPVLFAMGAMGLFKIPLNTGTCLVAMITLGLAVDDTIHLMARFKTELKEIQNTQKCVSSCIKKEISPVFATSLSLSLLFFSLTISDMTQLKNLGLLSGMVILYAFFCDIFFTTSLLTNTQFITIFDLLTLKVKREILNSKLFTGLKLNQVKELILRGMDKTAKAGEYLIHANEIGDDFIIILEGEVEVSIFDEEKGHKVVFNEYKEGDLIGELAGLIPIKRSADIIAKTEVRYFQINREGLDRLERLKPRIAGTVYHNLSIILAERVYDLNRKYLADID